jgi:hypothetical protein
LSSFGNVGPPSNGWYAIFHCQLEYQLSVFGGSPFAMSA